MRIIEEKQADRQGRKILCKRFVEELEEGLKQKIAAADKKIPPTLVIYNTKPSAATSSYIKAKVARGERLGIKVIVREMANEPVESIYAALTTDIMNGRVHGIILQLPMREDLDEEFWTNLIPPSKDVDGLTESNQRGIYRDTECFKPCTTEGIEKLILKLKEELGDAFPEYPRTTIVGRSKLVTKPLAEILQNRYNHTVAVCHSKTTQGAFRNLCSTADIIVTAAGCRDLIDEECIKGLPENKILIDVSTNRNAEGKLCGDISEGVKNNYPVLYTPVPGGVGQLTTYFLMEHVVKAWLLDK